MEPHEEYYSLIFDEITIKEDLVMNAQTGELVVFQNLNTFRNKIKESESETMGTQQKIDNRVPLASKVLQIMIRGLTTPFKYPYAFFPCKTLKSDDLYSIIFESIANLQGAGFKILTVVCDKAGPNQRFIRQCMYKRNTNRIW